MKVGDTVVFNRAGLQAVFGSDTGLNSLLTRRMKVTWVDPQQASPGVHVITVDEPELKRKLLTDVDFTVVNDA